MYLYCQHCGSHHAMVWKRDHFEYSCEGETYSHPIDVKLEPISPTVYRTVELRHRRTHVRTRRVQYVGVPAVSTDAYFNTKSVSY
jgi:hypothetical protein